MSSYKERIGKDQKKDARGSRSRMRMASADHTTKGTAACTEEAGVRAGMVVSAGKRCTQAPGCPVPYAPNPDAYGSGRGVLTMAPDFDEPLEDFGDLT